MTETTPPVRTKICGLTTSTDLQLAVDAGADAIGLLTDVPVETPREIDRETARSLLDATPPFVTSVVVTMQESVAEALSLLEAVPADAIQIHGLDPAAVETLAARTASTVIAATDPADAHRYDGVCDGLLIDSLDDDGAGGTGTTHDWNQTRQCVTDTTVPVIVAGGLTPANVTAAIEQTRPFGVDVASGVERSGGRKDPAAVRAFVATARTVEVPA